MQLKSDQRVDETVAQMRQRLERSDDGAKRGAGRLVARQVAALEATVSAVGARTCD